VRYTTVPALEQPPYLRNKQALRILEAARVVFVREGTAGFSARRVAKAAGLSLGSVQHVFRTTNDLLTAMIEYVSESYWAAYRRMAERLPYSAEERLSAMLDYLLADICQAEVRQFFFGFWSLSCHNPQARSSQHEAYRRQANTIAGFIAAARPQLSDAECLELATHITALIDGMMLFTQMSDKPLSNKSRLIKGLRKQLWSMINTAIEAPSATIPSRIDARDRRSEPPTHTPERPGVERTKRGLSSKHS
jgi:AcrR family transcriptional regulator